MNPTQNMISPNLNTPFALGLDKQGFLVLVPCDSLIRKTVPCDPGEIVDVIVDVESNKQHADRDMLAEYTEYTKPHRTPGQPYCLDFFNSAQQWLKDNGIDFQVFRESDVIPQPVNVYIDSNLRPVDGECKYCVTFGDTWVFRRMHGNLPNGKPNQMFNLEELQTRGFIAAPAEGTHHKTSVLGLQCAQLYLNTMQMAIAEQHRLHPENV